MKQQKISLLIILIIVIGILQSCGSVKDLNLLNVRELYDTGLEKYNEGRYVQSIEYFQTIVFNYPGETLIDSAQYYLAMSYFGHKDYVLSGVEFNRLLINYPSSPFAVEAQLLKAVSYFKGTPENYGLDQSDLDLAIEQFEDFIMDYPESESIPLAKQYLLEARTRLARKTYESGVLYERLSDFRAARIYFQKVIDDYTDTEYAPMATYQMAEIEYRDKNWEKAHELFYNFTIVFNENELADKAQKKSCQAILKAAEQAFDKNDFNKAKELFQRTLDTCNDKDISEKVAEYMRKLPVISAQTEEGDADL